MKKLTKIIAIALAVTLLACALTSCAKPLAKALAYYQEQFNNGTYENLQDGFYNHSVVPYEKDISGVYEAYYVDNGKFAAISFITQDKVEEVHRTLHFRVVDGRVILLAHNSDMQDSSIKTNVKKYTISFLTPEDIKGLCETRVSSIKKYMKEDFESANFVKISVEGDDNVGKNTEYLENEDQSRVLTAKYKDRVEKTGLETLAVYVFGASAMTANSVNYDTGSDGYNDDTPVDSDIDSFEKLYQVAKQYKCDDALLKVLQFFNVKPE